jgi:hypothetical protein
LNPNFNSKQYAVAVSSCRKTLLLGNLSVPVPRAEHLVAMKVQAMKNDPSRTLQELADIGFLIHLPGIDQKDVRKYFEEGGLLNSYEEIRKRT